MYWDRPDSFGTCGGALNYPAEVALMPVETISESVLAKIPLFRNLNPTERRQLAEIIRVQQFAPGAVIIRQGEKSRHLWVVAEGKCEVAEARRDSCVGRPTGSR